MARVNILNNGKVEGYLTVTEASKKMKQSATVIRKLIRDGEIPAIKLYRIYLIRERDAKMPKASKKR